jgi:hypothetical protein
MSKHHHEKQENKPVIQNQEKAVAQYQYEEPEVLRSDVVVPYLVCMQGMSDFVQARKAQIGEICKSTDPTKLGDPEHPVNAIFLHYPKAEWVLEEKPKGKTKYEYRSVMPRGALNETLEWNYWSEAGGDGLVEADANAPGSSEWRRVKRLSVFAILLEDLQAERAEQEKAAKGEAPDLSKALTPVIISFRSMSYNAGKEVVTLYNQAKSFKLPIWKYAMPLGVKFEQNDLGSFYIWSPDRTKMKAISGPDLATIERWASIVGTLKVHEEGDKQMEKTDVF